MDFKVIKLKNGSIEQIKNIKINDVLENGEKVYGLVEIFGITIDEQLVYYLGKNRLVKGGCNLCFRDESTSTILSTLELDIYNQELCRNESVLYHLLTDKGTFKVDDVIFCDYNTSIDLFLDKSKLLSVNYV